MPSTPTPKSGHDVDVAIVGSGFGGSVSALRLTEKGYRVAVLEAGRRWTEDTLPRTNWDLRRYLWFPRLGLRGFQRLTLLRDVFVLSGVAVGGGSVVYANTLYEPLEAFWTCPSWDHITDWRHELAPHYDQARRMLGATRYHHSTPADEVLRQVGVRMGVAHTHHPTEVGVFLGEPGARVPDPYFGGEGPERVGCIGCGGCMVGCRHEAKNTLDRNYLHLAEKRGARIHAETEVIDIEPLPGGGYRLHTDRPGAVLRHRRRTVTARHVILSAGALGTQRLLQRWRDEGRLPNLSDRLGTLVRTNSEAIVGATAPHDTSVAYSDGVAISSSIHVDEQTHVEAVRYPTGSDAMALMATALVDGGGRVSRPLRFLLQAIRHPIRFLRSLSVRDWARRTVILLVMQSRDNSIVVRRRRGLLGERLTSGRGHGEPNPTWIPAANEAARHAADVMAGDPQGSIFEALLDVPTTAHLIGGCPIGLSPEEGVIDPYHRVFGHAGLHVVDGSAVTANLGSNPSLTITAMAERAMSMWPNAGEPDPRPPLGDPYRRVTAVPPAAPAVPSDAPAALRMH
jgi:cholesterol oxidase